MLKNPPYKKKVFTTFLGLFLLSLLFLIQLSANIEQPSEEKQIVLYASQMRDDLKELFKKAISSAKSSIYVVIFTMSDPDILHLLNKKAEEGVDVKVIYDAKHSTYLKKKLGKKIHSEGRKELSGLMHRKILVVDREKIWIGSSNFTTESLTYHDNFVMGIYSKEMAQDIVHYENDHSILRKDYLIKNQRLSLYFLPDTKYAKECVRQMLKSAQKSVKIAMFTFTHPEFTEDIINAHKRGINVEMVVDRGTSLGASKTSVLALKAAKVAIKTHLGQQLFHHKFCIIDDKTLIQGSANWTRSAFKINEDLFLILYDLNSDQKNFLNDLWNIIRVEAQKV